VMFSLAEVSLLEIRTRSRLDRARCQIKCRTTPCYVSRDLETPSLLVVPLDLLNTCSMLIPNVNPEVSLAITLGCSLAHEGEQLDVETELTLHQ
jgi:hypothetical protein